MNKIKRILVPMNFSQSSLNAMETAIAMCKRHNANLYLLNVLETEDMIPTAGMNVPVVELVLEMEISRSENLKTLARKVRNNHNIPCYAQLENGFTPYIICSKAELLNCDLIVMGHNSRKSLKTYLSGSHIYKVMKHANCPVLTVPENASSLEFKNILFPVRPVAGILEKYQFIEPIINKNKASVLLFGAANKSSSDFERVKKIVSRTEAQLSMTETPVDHEYYWGKQIAETIIERGKKTKADLIVMTTTLSRSLKRFFIEEYAKKMISNPNIPVLSIKPRGYDGGKDYETKLMLRTPVLS